VVETKVRAAAEQAAEKAYRDAIAAGKTPAQANKAANRAAKDAAEQVALDEAKRSARGAAEKAIDNGASFDPSKLDTAADQALKDYAAGTTGGNAKRLAGELDGLSEKDFLAKMKAEGVTPKAVSINGPPPQTMQVYEYGDGSVVRYKPQGDLNRPGPAYSVEVKKDPLKPDTGNADAAFKVDSSGRAVPKGPFDLKNPYPQGSPQAVEFENQVMNAGHKSLN